MQLSVIKLRISQLTKDLKNTKITTIKLGILCSLQFLFLQLDCETHRLESIKVKITNQFVN